MGLIIILFYLILLINNPVLFDHCNLTNVEQYLNQNYHPYVSLNIGMGKKRFDDVNDVHGYYKSYVNGTFNEHYLKALAYIKEDD